MRRRAGFRNRTAAGEQLAELVAEAAPVNPVVLGLVRGGIIVAAPVAHRLAAPLDVLVVRKLGLPSQPELAMGAIAEGGQEWINNSVVQSARVSAEQLDVVRRRALVELQTRVQRFRGDSERIALTGRTAILVDDGLATGATARAAIAAVVDDAAEVWFAAPVGAPDTVAEISRSVDRVICILQPERMMAVGAWYSHFDQVSDSEVIETLRHA